MATPTRQEHLRGAVALTGSAVIYALFSLVIREMDHMYSVAAQVTAGYTVALVALGSLVVVKRLPLGLNRTSLRQALILGCCSAMSAVLFTFAVTHLKVANAVFLLYAGNILASIPLGAVLLNEKFSKRKGLIVGLALIGVGTFADTHSSLGWGTAAAVGAGCMGSMGNAMRKSLGGVPRYSILLIMFVVAVCIGLLFMAISGADPIRTVSALALVATGLYAAGRISLTYLTLYGFRHVDINVGTILLSTELIFSAMLALVVYQEVPVAHELLGGAMILSAAILTAVPDRRYPRHPDASPRHPGLDPGTS